MTNTLLATDRLQSPLLMRQAEKPTGISYGPYGDRTPRANTPVSGFTGQPCEQHLSWYVLGNGHRTYNPMIMRFHSPDGLSPFGRGGVNAYAYCHGDPINFHDRSGRSKWLAAWTVIKDYLLPEWISPILTNSVNALGASQPALTIAATAIADRRNGTHNIDLADRNTQIAFTGSVVATVGALGEAAALPTQLVTATGNAIVIGVGYHELGSTIGASHQAGASRRTPESIPMTRADHTTVDGFDTVDTGSPNVPRSINLGGQRLRTPRTRMEQQHIEIANLRQRIRQLEADGQ
ncbi:RHS repeat-associated protein [Pseudomonas sp. TE6288]